MSKLEQYITAKNLRKRAAEMVLFDKQFQQEVTEHNRMLLDAEHVKTYQYMRLDKKVYHFPVLGIIGQLGLANAWNDPFYTCCRYALMDDGYKEIEEGESVLAELVDRVAHARSIIHTLPLKQQQAAQEKLSRLSFLVDILVAGLELFKDMLKTVSGDLTSLDSKYNDTALVWKKSFH